MVSPGNSGNGNPGNSNNGPDPDLSKNSENWNCPDPDKIISNAEFWTKLQKDPQTLEICEEEPDDCWDVEENAEETELTSEKVRLRRRRLLATAAAPSPTPTAKLDKDNLNKYDLTSKPMLFFDYPTREEIRLSMDHRVLRKIVYSHPHELGLTDLESRIACPIQPDPNKFQRVDCWAITDRNIRETIGILVEATTTANPNVLMIEIPMHECPTQRATYYLDQISGVAMVFHKGGPQDGKLWTMTQFPPKEIPNMLQQPEVKVITDLSTNTFPNAPDL